MSVMSLITSKQNVLEYFSVCLHTFLTQIISELQAECDEKLQAVYHQLLQAGVERQESEKVAKMKETLANVQRLFPGTCFT